MEIEKIKILHDHYKESFSYIREREKRRDLLFLIVLGLYLVLAFEIFYSAEVSQTITEIEIFKIKVKISLLPMAAWLNVTWMFLLALLIRYYQDCVNVERQYDYLHKLEALISKEIDPCVYNREGREYMKDYPLFSNYTWIFYTVIIPFVLLFLTSLFLEAIS